ncbi:MAG: outer membrane lipoprotein-sorting protein [Dysgonamonadaceae bacterium]|nr:outer membrane lipoprotein-sorting protein [Dysgonamonadaceae bacterium]MDD4728216.1 outer membrane lipoprotein-sorting protein [Dysgonamonadaceae bacterium]
MKYLITLLFTLLTITQINAQDATAILNKVDDNINSNTSITKSDMIIYGRRNQRTVTSVGYSEGKNKSFSEYLAPARERGTKMLKLEDNLWIYSPSTDRTIQLSGHMLKQSLMGSDLSYEDMMENRKLTEMYDAKVIGEETIDERKTWILQLNAKVDDATYDSRKVWIDTERYVPLREELFAKSGQLLKRTELKDVKRIDGRWYPTKMNYKDMLKDGKGTDFVVLEIEFDVEIPAYIFSKGALKR